MFLIFANLVYSVSAIMFPEQVRSQLGNQVKNYELHNFILVSATNLFNPLHSPINQHDVNRFKLLEVYMHLSNSLKM